MYLFWGADFHEFAEVHDADASVRPLGEVLRVGEVV